MQKILLVTLDYSPSLGIFLFVLYYVHHIAPKKRLCRFPKETKARFIRAVVAGVWG